MTDQTLPEEDRIRPDPAAGRLWFGLLGAPIAWAMHFAICYSLIGIACAAGWDRNQLLGLNSVAALVLLSTLAALPVALAALAVARRVGRHAGQQDQAQAERDRHMSRAGLLAGGFFLLALLFEALIALVVQPCG